MTKEIITKMFKEAINSDFPVFSIEKEDIRINITWTNGAKAIWVYLIDKKTKKEIKWLSYMLITNEKQYMKAHKLNEKQFEEKYKNYINCFKDKKDLINDFENDLSLIFNIK